MASVLLWADWNSCGSQLHHTAVLAEASLASQVPWKDPNEIGAATATTGRKYELAIIVHIVLTDLLIETVTRLTMKSCIVEICCNTRLLSLQVIVTAGNKQVAIGRLGN